MEKRIQIMEQCILQLQLKLQIEKIQFSQDIIPEYLRLIDIPPFIRAKIKAIQFNSNYEVKDAVFQNSKIIGLNRVYQGQWYNDKQNGRGQEYNEKEQKYFYGYWQNGIFVQGLIITEGYLFEGDTKDDQFLNGVLVFMDQRIYMGNFLQGELNDENGEYRCKTEKYIGGFKNGMKHGKGKLENDTFIYEGEFANNEIFGQGVLIEKENGWRQEGQFKDGKLDGKGSYIRSFDNYYEGEFKQGLRHGKGTLKRDGITFQGNFIEGKVNGWVQMIQDKRIFKCYFEKGEEDKNKRQLVQ